MIYADALAVAGSRPVRRTTEQGYTMLGYLDGSVDVLRGTRQVKRLGAGTGPALGYTDWEAER
jgi:hypothetical protein